MKSLFLFALLVFLPVGAFSQFVISGSVTDGNGEAIPYSTVTLIRETDSSVADHTITGMEGRYEIVHKEAGNYLLRVGSLGYSTKTAPVILFDNTTIEVDFILEDNLIAMDGVVVTARNTGIRFLQDTIRYDPKVFTDGSEVILGDVLNKLPGVEVDEKGSVKAQGKQVESILLNGQDFFSGNTQMATKNLPASVAENVEVLNNYSEYSLLSGFQSHEKTVINVGVSDDKLGKISGELTAAGGYKNRYLGKANLMQIAPKLMTSLLGALNNTGEEVFSIEEYIRLQGGINELTSNNSGSSITLSDEEAKLLIPQNNTFKRRSGLGAFNLAYQPHESLKLTAYFLFNQTKEASQDINRYNYTLPNNSLETTERYDGNGTNRLFSGLWKLNYQPSAALNLTYKGTVSDIDMSRVGRSANTIDRQQINAIDRHDARTFKTRHDVMAMRSLGRHLLTANLFFSYSDKPATYDMQVDSLLLPVVLSAEDGWYYARQRTGLAQTESGLNLSFLYKINPDYFINSSVNASTNDQKYNSGIFQDTPAGPPVEFGVDSLRNSIKTAFRDYNASVGLVKNRGLLRFKLGVSAHLYKFHNSKLGPAEKAMLNPMAEVSLFFSQKHVLNASFSSSATPIPVDMFLSGIVFDSYRSFRYNSLTDRFYSPKNNANLSYRIYDMFSNTMVVLTAMYSRVENSDTSDYTQEGLLTRYRPMTAFSNEFLNANLFVNKGLGSIPWTVKVNGGYNVSSFSNRSNGTDNRIRVESTSGKLQLESNYRKQIFNFECKAAVEYLKNSSSIGMGNTQLIQRYGGKVKLNFGERLFWATGLEYVINDAPDYKQNLYVLNTDLSYAVSKSFDLEIAGENMLHMDKQDWVATSYNGVYTSERYFRQIPGNIMLRARFRF